MAGEEEAGVEREVSFFLKSRPERGSPTAKMQFRVLQTYLSGEWIRSKNCSRSTATTDTRNGRKKIVNAISSPRNSERTAEGGCATHFPTVSGNEAG